MEYKIMIVEDDKNIMELLESHLKRFGFLVYVCIDFNNLLDEFEKIAPHIVLMDVNLPAYDGFYWCTKIRTKSQCPIVFLSARNSDSDQVYAIMSGGDDYITKPFSFDVVTAKIKAVIRRTYGEYATASDDKIECLDCIFYKNKLTISCSEKEIELSKTEAAIIRIIFEEYPDVVSRESLLCEIWDDETFVEENTLNVAISRIRKKLNLINSNIVLKSVRGIGYRIGEINEK